LIAHKDGWREDSPKSANSTRVVPMNARVVAALGTYLAEHPQRHDPSARLWPGRNYAGGGEWRGGLDWDKRMDYESFCRRRFRSAAEGIGRPTLRFHDLRHTAASLWAASGVPLEMVAAVLGHVDTGITYKTYLHFFPEPVVALHGRHGRVPRSPRRTGHTATPSRWVVHLNRQYFRNVLWLLLYCAYCPFSPVYTEIQLMQDGQ